MLLPYGGVHIMCIHFAPSFHLLMGKALEEGSSSSSRPQRVVKRGPRSPLTFANATDALRRGTDGQEESSKVDKAEVSGKSGGSAWKLEEHPAESTKLRNHVLYECRSFCCACAAFEAIFSRVHLLQFRCFLFLVRSVELHDPAGYMGGWS